SLTSLGAPKTRRRRQTNIDRPPRPSTGDGPALCRELVPVGRRGRDDRRRGIRVNAREGCASSSLLIEGRVIFTKYLLVVCRVRHRRQSRSLGGSSGAR